jgi:hypothetical protein
MDVLKEHLSESDYDAFEEINEHLDYKKMYQNTIGKIIYLEDSDKVLAINVNQAASSWYTECWKNNAELPKKVSDLTCEEINDIYEKHYKNSGYIMSNIEKRDLKYKFKDGKLIYDVDEIFSCVGYPDIHEKLAPGWNEYGNYCNYIFGDSTNLYTNNGYEIINKDNDFPDWEMYFLPTLDEFIRSCKALGLHAYVELKTGGNYTEDNIRTVLDVVKKYAMNRNVTFISFDITYLEMIKNNDETARLGYVVSGSNNAKITEAIALQTGRNEVFIDADYQHITEDFINTCKTSNIPLETWTINSEEDIIAIDEYISGITSDSLIASNVLYENAMK